MKRWLNIKEIAKLCNRTESTLQKWIEKGLKLSVRLGTKMAKTLQNGSSVHFSLNQVVQILQAVGKPMIAELVREIKDNQPKVEAFDHFVNSKGLINMNAVAKQIGTGRKRLFEFLRIKKVLFLSGKTNLPYQRHIEAGYFKMKRATYKQDSHFIGYNQIFVTPKGEKWIAALWRKHNLPKGKRK